MHPIPPFAHSSICIRFFFVCVHIFTSVSRQTGELAGTGKAGARGGEAYVLAIGDCVRWCIPVRVRVLQSVDRHAQHGWPTLHTVHSYRR